MLRSSSTSAIVAVIGGSGSCQRGNPKRARAQWRATKRAGRVFNMFDASGG
jgi:hypothetical protein